MIKKNIIVNLIVAGLLLILMIQNIPSNSTAYETESAIRMGVEQSSNNFQLLGAMGTIENYTYYNAPTIDSDPVDHDITLMELTNIQQFSLNTTNLNYSTQQPKGFRNINNKIYEYQTDSPFETAIFANFTYNCSEYINLTNSHTINTGTDSYTPTCIDSDDGVVETINSNFVYNKFLNTEAYCTGISHLYLGYLDRSAVNNMNSLDGLDFYMEKVGDPAFNALLFPSEFTTAGYYKIKIIYETTTANSMLVFDKNGIAQSIDLIYPSTFADTRYYEFYSDGLNNIRFAISGILRVDFLKVMLKQTQIVDVDYDFVFLDERINSTLPYKLEIKPEFLHFNLASVKINGISVTFSEGAFNVYTGTILDTDINIRIESEYAYFDYDLGDACYLDVDYVWIYPYFKPINVSNIVNFKYSVNAIVYYQNISMIFSAFQGNQTYGYLIYRFDSSILTEYDYANDLTIDTQDLKYNYSVVVGINISISSSYSFSEWIVPSEIDLKCNSIEVTDDTYNSGSVAFTTYQEILSFTALTENILFNFSILSTFSYSANLDILSRSYFAHTFALSNYHAVTVTLVQYLFDSSIKHSYLNNVDYSTAKTISPSFYWSPSSTLKIEVILGDDAYLPLEPINLLANSSSLLSIFARSNVLLFSDVGTQAFSFTLPTGFNAEQTIIDISNIHFTESYTHSENNTYNTYSEPQTYRPSSTTISNSSESFSYYDLYSISNSTSISSSIADTLNCTTAGKIIENAAVGTDVAGIGGWSDHGTQPPETCAVLTDFSGHNKPLQIGHSTTAGHYAILMYQSTATTTLSFDIWIYTVTTTDAIRCWADNDFSKTTIGFYLENTIQVCDAVGSTTNTGIVVPLGWNNYHVEWVSGVSHKLWLNGNLIDSRVGYTRTGTKKFQIGIYQPTASAANMYINQFALSDEAGYVNFMSWNSSVLNQQVDFAFPTLSLANLKNISLAYMVKSNISTTINMSIFDYKLNVVQYCNSSTDIIDNLHEFNIPIYAQNYINASSLNFTIFFTGFNLTSAFDFNLTYINITLNCYNNSISEIAPNLVVTSSNFLYVGQSNSISISVQHTMNSLHTVKFWDNISNNVQYLGSSDGNYSAIIQNSTSQYYSVGVFVNDTNSNWKCVNITNIFIAENSSEFALTNLYQQYYQNQTLNISTTLNRNVSLMIYFPNGTVLQSDINRSIYSIGFNTTGWYRVNATFDNNTNQFLNFSVETVFEVLPISRDIAFSQSVSLIVNTQTITNNSKTLYYLNNSFTLSFSADSITTFDLSIYFLMNYTQTLSFSELSNANFTFTASSNISSIFTLNVSLSSYPTFLAFYYNGQTSTNYAIWNNSLYLLNANATTFLNRDYFTLGFTISGDDYLQQITSPILTTDTNVNFREYYQADRAFRNWYITSTYDINSITLTRTSTLTAMSLTYENPNWYFQYTSAAGDLYSAIWGIDPNFDVEYTVVSQNSLNTTVDVRVKSDLYVENLTVVVLLPVFYDSWDHGAMGSDRYLQFDINYSTTTWQTIRCIGLNQSVQQSYSILSSNGTYCQIAYTASANFAQTNYTGNIDLLQFDIYHENWTASTSDLHDLTQNLYTKQISFIIPSFVGAYTCVFTGVSRVPYASVDRYISDLFMEISLDLYANYTAYLQYPQYSENFILNLSDAWVLDGVHYMNDSYDILSWGYFVCPGWGASISSSYLKFSCNPIVEISRIDDGDYVYIYVNSTLPMENATYQLELDIEESYQVICNYTTRPVNSKLMYISGIMIEPGINILVFYIQRVSLAQSLSYLFMIIAIAVGLTGYYLYKRYNASNEPFWSFRWITKKTKQASKAKMETPADRKPEKSDNKSTGGQDR